MGPKKLLKFSIIAFFAGMPLKASAYVNFVTSQFSFSQRYFTGEKNISLAESKTGYCLEFGRFLDGERFTPFIRTRVLAATGNQNFLDNSVESKLAFSFYHVEGEVGFHFFLIPRKTSGINLYLTASGTAGLSYISFSNQPVTSRLPKSDKGAGGGYVFGLGIEKMFSDGTRKWNLFSEIQNVNYESRILGQRFDLGGLLFSAGLGW